MLESFLVAGPPGPRARRAAHLRPVDHRRLHGLGHDRRTCSTSSPRRCVRGAQAAVTGRGRRRGADRRLDRPGRARAAGRRGAGLGPRARRARGRARARRARRGAPARSTRPSADAETAFVARARRRAADEVVAERAGRRRPGLRGDRRRLDQARRCVARHDDPRFVGGHPLAGAETAGVAHARADLFEGATWYLTPTASTSGACSTSACTASIAALGAQPVAIDAATHDRLMAACLPPPARAGQRARRPGRGRAGRRGRARCPRPGRASATRPASPAPTPRIWTDIYLANREALDRAQIDDAVRAPGGGARALARGRRRGRGGLERRRARATAGGCSRPSSAGGAGARAARLRAQPPRCRGPASHSRWAARVSTSPTWRCSRRPTCATA